MRSGNAIKRNKLTPISASSAEGYDIQIDRSTDEHLELKM